MVVGRALVAACLLLAPIALAHDAPEGWSYDRDCCSDRDCAPVADEAIREVEGGFQIDLRPGEHPALPAWVRPISQFLPHGSARVRVSGDGHKHACVSTIGGLYCIYLPSGGV